LSRGRSNGVCEHHKLRAVAVDSWKFQIAVFINSREQQNQQGNRHGDQKQKKQI